MPHDHLRIYLSIDDAVIFEDDESHLIGKIVDIGANNKVTVLLFAVVTEELLTHYSLARITATESPRAMKSGMEEVMLSESRLEIDRSKVIDVAFILLLHEVEGGLFHLTGARNTFFIQYENHHLHGIIPYPSSMFQPRIVEPYSFRIFRSLNSLSSSIKKAFYHHPEQQSLSKTLRIPFTYEAFFYVSTKFSGKGDAVMHQVERTQRCILYYDDLSMKSSSRINQVHCIRILTTGALHCLREVLGVGIGVGLGKPRPSKAKPEAYCAINDTITSLELAEAIPMDYILNPLHRLDCNGIDFIYTVDNQSLQCNIRFSKLVVVTEAIVFDRIRTATVHSQTIVPYIGAMFFMRTQMLFAVLKLLMKALLRVSIWKKTFLLFVYQYKM